MDPDGFVTLVDRKRDVILASGFSIFPSEIEDVLCEHHAVAECAVVGVPHFYRGETVKAYVVLRDGSTASEDELRAFCAYKLVAYKVPTQFEFRTELPKNMLGKVLRRTLRAEHEQAHARVAAQAAPQPAAPGVDADLEAAAAAAGLEVEDVTATTVLPSVTPAEAAEPADPAEPHPARASGSFIDALERLVRLHSLGELTDEEFHAAKARLLQ
jgi:hypothetical protein